MPLDQTSYDELPYTCNAMPYAQPDRLATIGRLFGMNPPPVSTCRLLELGCGDGSNIISTAYGLPQAHCVGIDLSAQQIASGQSMIRDLDLHNITVKQLDIMQVDASLGQFDYIIAHGIYSWVPTVVQNKILNICQQLLTANGIAYVSYNTKPGWNMRSTIRDMMLYHTIGIREPNERVNQLRALLKFLADSTTTGKDSYSLFLNEEFKTFIQLPGSYLFHEFLEEENQPLYFYQFVERARAQGLDYLGDAFLHNMLASNFPAEVASKLDLLKSNLVQQEQYMDFLRNCHFRHTLLCHQGTQLQRALTPDTIKPFYISSSLQPTTSNGDQQQFENNKGTLTSSQPIVKMAFRYLGNLWPGMIAFSELCQQVGYSLNRAMKQEEQDLIAEAILLCYSRGLIDLYTTALPFTLTVNQYPQASAIARWQAQRSRQVANMRNELITIENVVCLRILPYLDGTRDQPALVKLLTDWVNQGVLALNVKQQESGEPITLTDEQQIQDALNKVLTEALRLLANAALLVV